MTDPQISWCGPGEALARVAAWMRLCECGHPAIEHDLADPRTKRRGVRTECLTTERTGKCPCTIYEPAPEPSDVT